MLPPGGGLLPPVPFLQPHELVVVAVGGVGGVEFGGERFGAGQVFARRFGEAVEDVGGEGAGFGRLVRVRSLAEVVLVLGQRPIFEGAGGAGDAFEAAAFGDQGEQAELEREAFGDGLGAGGLAGLVVDDRQRAVGVDVDAVDLAV